MCVPLMLCSCLALLLLCHALMSCGAMEGMDGIESKRHLATFSVAEACDSYYYFVRAIGRTRMHFSSLQILFPIQSPTSGSKSIDQTRLDSS